MASVWYISFRKKKINFEKYPSKKKKEKSKKRTKKKNIFSLFLSLLFILPINLIFGKLKKEQNEK